jgi:hypothetical protein
MADDDRTELERHWRAEMERLGPDVVCMRLASRMSVTERPPHPDPKFAHSWLRKKERAARRRAAWRFGITLLVAAVSMIAACIAAWPVIEERGWWQWVRWPWG